jgi:beta-galactosidase
VAAGKAEFHYTRVPDREWEPEILKMKVADVQIIATYVIGIHHEEIESQFDWSGERDLRNFLELSRKHGM